MKDPAIYDVPTIEERDRMLALEERDRRAELAKMAAPTDVQHQENWAAISAKLDDDPMPRTPQGWLEKYNAILAAGRGLTAREWDHYGELERTVQRQR